MVHLYSGRWRAHDFHARMDDLLASMQSVHVRILSIDTAVDPRLNIHDHTLWAFLLEASPTAIGRSTLRTFSFQSTRVGADFHWELPAVERTPPGCDRDAAWRSNIP